MKHRAFRTRVRPTKAKPLNPLNRHLTFEPLEDRRMLANVTVSNLNDLVNGNVASIADLTAGDGGDGISLREAIQAANNTNGADTVDFAAALSAGGTINLLSQLLISDALTIDASALTGELKLVAGFGFRVLNIDDGDANNQSAVQLLHLTLTGGFIFGDLFFSDAGAIFNRENLTITGCSIAGNHASSRGGGIFNEGTATVIDSTLADNWGGFAGGGIFNGGNLEVINSTISGNGTATYSGGVYNNGSGMATILGSTLTDNYGYYGGAIYNRNGTMTITNSTLSGNTAGWFGGGMGNTGTAAVTSSTFTGNSAIYGGGIMNIGNLDLNSNLIAGNTAGDSADVIGLVTIGAYNLVGTGADGLVNGVDGNQVGSSGGPINPLLGPLQDNGGPTLTHALLPGSPAINAGDSGFMPPPDFDQRGAPFTRVSGGRIDIGAFEVQAAVVPSADFDGDGFISGLDFLLWQIGFPTPAPNAVKMDGDADNDTDVDGFDLDIWELQYGGPAPLVALSMGDTATAYLAPQSVVQHELAAGVAAPVVRSLASADLVDLALTVALADRRGEPLPTTVTDADALPFAFATVDWISPNDSPAPSGASGPTTSATPDDEEQTSAELSPWENAIDEAFAAVFA
jgi:hypothetical protein